MFRILQVAREQLVSAWHDTVYILSYWIFGIDHTKLSVKASDCSHINPLVEKYAKIYNLETKEFIRYLTSTPQFTTVRVNLKHTKPGDLVEIFRKQLLQKYKKVPVIWVHPDVVDCIIIGPVNELCEVHPHEVEVLVDQSCGQAVLRGAHIFAPGVKAIISSGSTATVNSSVSVYVDVAGKCLRGRTAPYLEQKQLIASGLLRMSRQQLFANQEDV